ncbi:MAG: hypothetical protein CM15mP102_16520 [Flavobacteriales bacterium]|nr:MAG: hypothetical protein CM15mP102_16520 [Flavobacteriales bacterium]
MKITAGKINRWLIYKLPAAWLTGVRLSMINGSKCEVKLDSSGLIKTHIDPCSGLFKVWQLSLLPVCY